MMFLILLDFYISAYYDMIIRLIIFFLDIKISLDTKAMVLFLYSNISYF